LPAVHTMISTCPTDTADDDGAKAFYAQVLQRLREERLPFLVGGSFAFAHFTGIHRATKDLDLFIRQAEWERLADAAAGAGWQADLSYPHWLGKIVQGEHFVDVIFNSGNGLSPVDDDWFRHAVVAQLMGHAVLLAPAEESLWTKAFIMERERFDGADVAHLLLACAPALDWQRLLQRFGVHWRVLFAHLVLFGFIYPGERDRVPAWLTDELTARWLADSQPGERPRLCAGTLLSREQYLPDVAQAGYLDARLLPHSTMKPADIAEWSSAIDDTAGSASD
jgi:hypothetical protein